MKTGGSAEKIAMKDARKRHQKTKNFFHNFFHKIGNGTSQFFKNANIDGHRLKAVLDAAQNAITSVADQLSENTRIELDALTKDLTGVDVNNTSDGGIADLKGSAERVEAILTELPTDTQEKIMQIIKENPQFQQIKEQVESKEYQGSI